VLALGGFALLLFAMAANAQTPAPGALQVPAKTLSAPGDVSPQLAKIIGAPLRTNWDIRPQTGEEWKPAADAGAAALICDAGAIVHANGHDMKDPMLSPVYGDMHGFPPTILTSGTRDLLLSNTVRVHRKLRQAGVEAFLQAYEGMAHAHYIRDDTAPESREVFDEIAGFFDHPLDK
jgi:acetyl esterase/lipase